MTDPMQEIRASFFVECEELLEALQDGLEAMEGGAQDAETVNTVFRAVHSIKGGAGAFGLDELVAFAHRFETALDALRSGQMSAGPDEMRLFFMGGDLLSDLVQAARDGRPGDPSAVDPVANALDQLVDAPDLPEAEPDFTPTAIALDLDFPDEDAAPATAQAGSRLVTLRFQPDASLYATGNEPAFLLRALSEMGDLTATCTIPDLPDLDAYDPADALIGWTVGLRTAADLAAIQEIFDFVDGLCTLDIAEDGSAATPPAPALAPGPEATTAPGNAELAPDLPAAPAPVPPPVSIPAPAAAATDTPPESTAASAKATVRVELDRIDRLVNLVGELVINQAMLSQAVTSAGQPANSSLAAGLDEFHQLTRDIQESVMMIRAQPIKPLFQRMSRIVREASAAVGKDVRLKIVGEATEIDKTVIERLADPLTHMIRNAVDHGLETPAGRTEAGKRPEGQITLSACHRSGRVVVEVADDGRGIDRPKVRSIAESKGLVPPDQTLSDAEIDALLFLPGFSTASTVSNLSGRGVGMDVVKSAISALGGRIAIASEPGHGTTFTISLPLTLAVLDGMVVRVAGETLVVPLAAITETLSLAPRDVRLLAPGAHVMEVRGQVVPLLDLGVELGYRADRAAEAGAIVLLVGQDDGTRAALIVDAIEDQRQVVIKGLQDSYGRVPGVAAATILGDGQIALILDPADLVSGAARRDAASLPLRRTA